MSGREIITGLPRLTVTDLHAVGQRTAKLTSRKSIGVASDSRGGLRTEQIAGRLVLSGPRVIRQAEVEAILDEFP